MFPAVKPQQVVADPGRRDEQVLDRETFRRLVDDGQELRRAFDAQTARMRVITPDDMKIRSR